MSEKNQITTKKEEVTLSERFVNNVVAEFGNGGDIVLAESQKRLAKNYFMSVDNALQEAEKRRNKNNNAVAYSWNNVDLTKISRSVVAYARIGLDPLQKNHIFPIPFFDTKSGKYVMSFMEGYQGIELKAKKYAIDPPTNITVELVKKNDSFKVIKKGVNSVSDSYDFEITNPFDRGEVVGGFYYMSWDDKPSKNKLVVVPLSEILKRKPEKASSEFWGGEKTIWKDKKPAGTEKVEGWFEQMCEKTIKRMAYGSLTIDPKKIDDAYYELKRLETEFAEMEVDSEVHDNSSRQSIDITEHVQRHDVSNLEEIPNDDDEQF